VKARTLLELGRVSNLPTVFSNVLCGAALTGERLRPLPLALAVLAGSLFYVGGMFLNDAFDATIDAKERPERPIPSGRAERATVLGLGLGMLAAGEALLAVSALGGLAPSGALLPVAGWVTATCVIVYDRWHKGLAWSPLVMGLCRAGLYVIGAASVAETTRSGWRSDSQRSWNVAASIATSAHDSAIAPGTAAARFSVRPRRKSRRSSVPSSSARSAACWSAQRAASSASASSRA